jgi:hypothetical protein
VDIWISTNSHVEKHGTEYCAIGWLRHRVYQKRLVDPHARNGLLNENLVCAIAGGRLTTDTPSWMSSIVNTAPIATMLRTRRCWRMEGQDPAG